MALLTSDAYKKQNVLILVKTYPTPSQQHREVVCTAGVTEAGQWIRLFPIPYRALEDEQRYKVFSWVNVATIKGSDGRPETYRVAEDSITVLRSLDPRRDIEERIKYIEGLEISSAEEMERLYRDEYKTLGVFSPKEVVDLEITPTARDWTDAERTKLLQASLLDSGEEPRILEKIPYAFHLHWRCNDSQCTQIHRRLVTEWEIMQAYRSYTQQYGTEEKALLMLKHHYLERFNSKDYKSYIFTGNMLRAQPTFLVVGHYWYPRKNRKQVAGQQSLGI